MSFDTYFRASSYALITVAALALTLAGGLQVGLAIAFAAVLIVAWKLEGTKWQLSERVGLLMLLLSAPLLLFDWQYQKAIGESSVTFGISALAHLIVFLSAIKLFQAKSDRDWVFLYLISFFELLLAAGLSFSPVFLLTLCLYLLCGISTVTALEIRKARRVTKLAETRLLVPPDSSIFQRLARGRIGRNAEIKSLPFVALLLLALIFILGLPLFLIAPRVGSPVISHSGTGLTNFIGFSETVSLGAIGQLKQNDTVVMRIRLEDSTDESDRDLRWRGVALDEFSGRSWRKSAEARQSKSKTLEQGLFRLGTTEDLHHLTTQRVFLEPMDSRVLFSAARVVAIQGNFSSLRVDQEGSIQSYRSDSDRIIYKAFSDTSTPRSEVLRQDSQPYPRGFERYQQLPHSLDQRIRDLARTTVVQAHALNRYDMAKAIESHLQNDYRYTVEMRATGPDPLSDFLFNVRAGHCEYFSTAMAVMLRTQGMAARVVNGFLPGEYNEAADAYTIRQSDAHSWVEVYFPATSSWVTFDPTPVAGRTEPQRAGFAAQIEKYTEALQLMWFQYVIGYDKQEQRSLATSLHNHLFDFRRWLSQKIGQLRNTGPAVASWTTTIVLLALAIFVSLVLARRVSKVGWRRALRIRLRDEEFSASAIDFYERMLRLLAERGKRRSPDQTPLEFATVVGLPVFTRITSVYHRVRYGAESLSADELQEIEDWLQEMEREGKRKAK